MCYLKKPSTYFQSTTHKYQSRVPHPACCNGYHGTFPESKTGNHYILVVANYLTKWTEAYPIHNQEATTVARKLTDKFFRRFSPPEQLHSDQGQNFESAVIADICKLLAIKKSRTTPYHSQSDGLVERCNRTILSMMATAVADHPLQWEDHVRTVWMAYNTSSHSISLGILQFI